MLVSCIGFIRSKNYPEYKDKDQALSYIWVNVSSIEIELDSTTCSYLFVSSLPDTARDMYLLQIYEFKYSRGVENTIFEGVWNEKEKKVIWCEVTPIQESLIKFVFEKIKNPKKQLIGVFTNWLKNKKIFWLAPYG